MNSIIARRFRHSDEGSRRRPAPLGWCRTCHRLFAVRLLRKEPGKYGPTRVYRCKKCSTEEKYECGPDSRYCLY